ncbi:MAG TPA: DUF1572 family protein [Gemmatimonadaceae bacterium]|jgi:hypothetical protein|nr:DUF1572 family protein [Gemmatimonadaceae bacterium]
MLTKSFLDEYARYRVTAEKAMAQISDEALNRVVSADGNSIATLVRHISGNMVSRFTDFMASDGEKSWRERDAEFDAGPFSRAEVDDAWRRGWEVLEREVGRLRDEDFMRTVTIRGQGMTVLEALLRNVTHIAMHIGQIILLARVSAGDEWKTLSIPRGQSRQFNEQMAREHPAR